MASSRSRSAACLGSGSALRLPSTRGSRRLRTRGQAQGLGGCGAAGTGQTQRLVANGSGGSVPCPPFACVSADKVLTRGH